MAKPIQKNLFGERIEKENPRKGIPIDLFFNYTGAVMCCLAVEAGWKYGFRSDGDKTNVCPYANKMGERHRPNFIDNDYLDYRHEDHLKMIKKYRPKYASTKDIISEEHCKLMKIKFEPLEKILDYAEEINEYAENVILIPKYDCIDEIPEKFILGYSIQTSYGGTPMSIDKFKGRRVHLLGGSWKKQLEIIKYLKGDVISLDNNYVCKMSRWGSFVDPDGTEHQISEFTDVPLTNPRYVAATLSFGAIAYMVRKVSQEIDDGVEWRTTEEDVLKMNKLF